ncbi:peptide ABC transporter substrate-binding protein [Actomonas aquatica]|uniref:Peptide ABC transporter substrate-binding protein n=1 Tax=Actomonas aquatica TaxID=2866162 RepID=A0ABZ1C4E6_9BACT|nr:peptide ABC transporter substrate-binding protein [Opitutus sp. WL0086]WRQ86593.1 peptide ABC transporter substrate-binding protein [Opitutus sp. WL0086]
MRPRFAAAPLTLLSALLLLLLMAVGCAPRESAVEVGNREGVLHLAISDEPETLDPHLAIAFSDMQVITALFEGLTALDANTSRIVPGAAESWETSTDGLTWTFHLREGLQWSDGTPLDAQTFRDSFVRALAPSIGSEYAYVLFPIKNAERFAAGEIPDFVAVGVKVVDPLTLRIELEHPTPALPAILTLPVAYPVPLHVLRQLGGTINLSNPWARAGTLIGNGPFQLTEWSPDQHLRAERNPHFRTADAVALNAVVFHPYANVTAQENAFRAGQLHITSGLPLTKIKAYQTDAPELLRLDPFFQTAFMRFNTTRPPLDNPRVRRALALAIDRDALADHVLTGGERAAPRLTPPNTNGYTAETPLRYDPDEARRLLAAAGYPKGDGLRPLEVITRPREIDRLVLEAIQQMWQRELGLRTEIAVKEQRVWLSDERALNYDISNAAWIGDYLDPETFLALFITDGGNNATGWSDAAYDDALARAARAPDEATRLAAYQEAETRLLTELPMVPLYHGTQPFLIRPEVRGWTANPLSFRRYQDLSLEPSAATELNLP